MVVADAGPLIAMARIGKLQLLKQVLGEVWVPPAVVRECLQDRTRADARAIRQALAQGTLLRRGPRRSPVYEEWLPLLGEGETAAVTLARTLHARVLLDDKEARRVATSLGVPVIGTGGVLVRAKAKGLIPTVTPLLSELREKGYWFSDALVAEILQRSGE